MRGHPARRGRGARPPTPHKAGPRYDTARGARIRGGRKTDVSSRRAMRTPGTSRAGSPAAHGRLDHPFIFSGVGLLFHYGSLHALSTADIWQIAPPKKPLKPYFFKKKNRNGAPTCLDHGAVAALHKLTTRQKRGAEGGARIT